MNFHVMQPGSSIATSLVPGEAAPKKVAILSITGRDFECETIPLRTMRPFAMKEIVLSEEKEAQKLARKDDHRTELSRFLIPIVDELIERARTEWLEMHIDPANDEEVEVPLPLVHLRVETSTPAGGMFQCENPQRFSNRFVGKVANANDVVHFYRDQKRKSKGTSLGGRTHLGGATADVGEASTRRRNVTLDQPVREELDKVMPSVLPKNGFLDALSQFIEKDDNHAIESFVNKSTDSTNKYLVSLDDPNEEMDDKKRQDSIEKAMQTFRVRLEEEFNQHKARERERYSHGKKRFHPKPDGCDSSFDGHWENQPGSLMSVDDGEEDQNADKVDEDPAEPLPRSAAARGRGQCRGGRAGKGTTTARSGRTASTATKGTRVTNTPSSSATYGTKNSRQLVFEEEEFEEDDYFA